MTETATVDPKAIYKEKMQVAIENLKQAELEGAEELAPDTYAWAKHKIYEDKKIILQHPEDQQKIEEASDDAAAAAAKLLSKVREMASQANIEAAPPAERTEKEAIKVLVNEGGPVK